MNERIKELVAVAEKQARDKISETGIKQFNSYFQEKFADLIIRECVSVFWRIDNGNEVEGVTEIEDFPKALAKHFGVKQ